MELALSLTWLKPPCVPGGSQVQQNHFSEKVLTNQERSRSLDDSKVGGSSMADFPQKRKDEQGSCVTSHQKR
jgi:hypothetical protein